MMMTKPNKLLSPKGTTRSQLQLQTQHRNSTPPTAVVLMIFVALLGTLQLMDYIMSDTISKGVSQAEEGKRIFSVSIPRNKTQTESFYISPEKQAALKQQRQEHEQVLLNNQKKIFPTCQGKQPLVSLLRTVLWSHQHDCPPVKEQTAAANKMHGGHVIFGLTTCEVQDLCPLLPRWNQIQSVYYQSMKSDDEELKGFVDKSSSCLAAISDMAEEDTRTDTTTTTTASRHRVHIRVAGLQHSGVQFLEKTLKANLVGLHLVSSSPSNAHVSAKYLNNNNNSSSGNLGPDEKPDSKKSITPIDLTVVVVRDPFRWITSMCKAKDVEWISTYTCPATVVPFIEGLDDVEDSEEDDEEGVTKVATNSRPKTSPVTVHYGGEKDGKRQSKDAMMTEHYDSWVSLWKTWHEEYLHDSVPKLMVRFEDLLFNPDQIVDTISSCAGGLVRKNENYVDVEGKGPAKNKSKHAPGQRLINSLSKHADMSDRFRGMSTDDLQNAKNELGELLQLFGYASP